MPRAKHPQEAQFPLCLVGPHFFAPNVVRYQSLSFECGLPGIFDTFRCCLATEPIADPVGVTSIDESGDAGANDARKGRKEGTGICREERSQLGGHDGLAEF